MARVVMSPGWEMRLQKATMDTTHEVAREVASDIRNNIRTGGLVKTGALLRSVRVRRLVRAFRVFVGTDHWAHLEYGTAPGIYYAPPGHVFRFVKANGEVVYTRWIRHPGIRARMFVRRAAYKRRVVRRG